MFKNQYSVRLEIKKAFCMQARLYLPRNEVGDRFRKDANGSGMNVE